MNSDPDIKNKPAREFGSIEMCRFLFCVLLTFHHYQQVTFMSFKWKTFNFYNGRFDYASLVIFFLMLSGFLSEYHRGTASDRRYFKGLLKKLARLYPMVIFGVILYVIAAALYNKLAPFAGYPLPTEFSAEDIVLALIGISSAVIPSFMHGVINTPLWFMAILIMCYVFYYLFLFIASRVKVDPVFFYIGFIVSDVILLTNNVNIPVFGILALNYYHYFFVGAVAERLYERFKGAGLWIRIFAPVSAAIVILFAALYKSPINPVVSIRVLIPYLYLCLIIICTSPRINRFFKAGIFSFLGKRAFSVYIFHMPVMILFYILLYETRSLDMRMSAAGMTAFSLFSVIFAFLMYIPVSKTGEFLSKGIKKDIIDRN